MNRLGWLLVVCLIVMAGYDTGFYSPQQALNILSTLGRRAYTSFYPSDVVRLTKFGSNLDVDNVAETLGALGDDPETRFTLDAETLSIVSSDAADDSAGTGARLLLLQCINSDGLQVDVVVVMDGTTPVVTTQTCKFLNRALVFSAGTGLRNAGSIMITQSTSGVDLAVIPANRSVTQQLEYYVPSDRRCFIDRLVLTGRKTTSGSARIDANIRIYSNFVQVVYDIRDYLLAVSATDSDVIEREDFKAEQLAPNEIFVVELTSSANNSAVTGSLDLTCKID
jgi:hypothetical protein